MKYGALFYQSISNTIMRIFHVILMTAALFAGPSLSQARARVIISEFLAVNDKD
jgi:hypothetical protein